MEGGGGSTYKWEFHPTALEIWPRVLQDIYLGAQLLFVGLSLTEQSVRIACLTTSRNLDLGVYLLSVKNPSHFPP